MAQWPEANSVWFSLKPLEVAPGGPSFFIDVDIVADRLLPLGRVDLRLPVLVEPAAAEGVHQRADEGHVLAPARLAAQADAVLLLRLVGELVGELA